MKAAADGWDFERHFLRNLTGVVVWECVWGFGQACVSNAILLAFVAQLTTSKTLIGAINLTYLLALPGLFLGSYLQLGSRHKRLTVGALHAAQTLAWVGVGAATISSSPEAAGLMLAIVFAAHAYVYVVNGFLVTPTYELLSRVFDRRWGTAQGIQAFCNRLMGVLGGLAAAALLASLPFPQNFGITFLVGGTCLVVSNLAVALMVEPPFTPPRVSPNLIAHLGAVGRIVRQNQAFCLLLVVTAVLALIQMAQGFYVVYALERLELDPSHAGIFASVTFASNGLGGLLMGFLGDRYGHRQLLGVAMGFYLLSFIAVVVMQSIGLFIVALALSAAATMGATISNINLACAFAPPGEKGTYASITRIVTAPATAIGMLASGLLVDQIGFVAVFSVCCILPVIGLVATVRMTPAESKGVIIVEG